MNRFLSISLTFLLSGASAAGAVISPSEALGRVFDGDNCPRRVASASQKDELTLSRTFSVGDVPCVYLFNSGNYGRYYIVSADDSAAPLLGYGDGQLADSALLPPAMISWIEALAEEIDWARSRSLPLYEAGDVERTEPIGPLVTTKWDQSAPFNDFCPMSGPKHMLTGCVATAMAQVMKYHNWPEQGQGSKRYSDNGETKVYEFKNTTFDWDSMLDSYRDAYTYTEAEAVANLMFACGVSVDMQYGLNSSSAYTTDVADALPRFFKYDWGARVFYREYYMLEDWKRLIEDQLRTFGPLVYAGHNTSGGHCFVCDGSDGEGFFHLNWGWSGMSDGYFRLTALDPVAQGNGGSSAGFSASQYFIGNVCPEGACGEIAPYMTCSQAFTLADFYSDLVKGGKMSFNGRPTNRTTTDLTMQLGVALKSADGEVTHIAWDKNEFKTLEPNYSYRSNNYIMPIPEDLNDGVYEVTPAFMTEDGKWYPVPIKINYSQYLTMTVEGDEISFDAAPVGELTAKTFELPTPFYIGKYFQILTTLVNESGLEYCGNINARLYDITSGNLLAEGGKAFIDLLPGESIDYEYLAKFTAVNDVILREGRYLLALVDDNSEEVITSSEIELNANPGETKVLVTDMVIEGAPDKVNSKSFTITADMECLSGFFSGKLECYLFYGNETGFITSYSSDFICLDNGGKTVVKFDASYDMVDPERSYRVYIYGNGGWLCGYSEPFWFADDSGVETVAEAGVVRSEWFTVSGQSVNADKAGKGIYIIRDTHSDGKVSVRKSVIL